MVRGGEHAGDGVRDGEDRVVVAPTGREREPVGPSSREAGEGAVEPLDRARRGAPPAVDGLAWVADGEDRMARVAPEERLEHPELADAGVLVLVEEHDLPAGTLASADLGRGHRDPRRVGHLIGVVDRTGGPLARLEGL